jgi:uncharacterized membrane protein YedE/YeeE
MSGATAPMTREARPGTGGLSAGGLAVVALCGALFGFGLALSGMVRPQVVLAFLAGRDLGLLLVMGGAVVVTLAAYRLGPRLLARPWLGPRFHAHPSVLDRDTLVGSALFGIGWGLSGVCPGPAIAGLGTGSWELVWALAGIVAGAGLHGLWAGRHTGPA